MGGIISRDWKWEGGVLGEGKVQAWHSSGFVRTWDRASGGTLSQSTRTEMDEAGGFCIRENEHAQRSQTFEKQNVFLHPCDPPVPQRSEFWSNHWSLEDWGGSYFRTSSVLAGSNFDCPSLTTGSVDTQLYRKKGNENTVRIKINKQLILIKTN